MTNSRHSFRTLWLLFAAAALMVLPEEMQAKCRLVLGDLLAPGCVIWRQTEQQVWKVVSRWQPAETDVSSENQQLRADFTAAVTRIRELESRLAQLQDELQAQRPPIFESRLPSATERLAQPVLIEAAVLGADHETSWRRGRWLAEGKAAGLLEEAPILADHKALLDVGQDAKLSAEDRLLWGRCVIGKVAQVGRWTSTFTLVTDAEFRGRAQLVRETNEGFVFGAKGVLKGQGDGFCQLEGISAEDTVSVGDRVYTANRDGLLPTPLYYGEVVDASLPDRAREWHVRVKPADRPADLTTVQVLRSTLNLKRVMAN